MSAGIRVELFVSEQTNRKQISALSCFHLVVLTTRSWTVPSIRRTTLPPVTTTAMDASVAHCGSGPSHRPLSDSLQS